MFSLDDSYDYSLWLYIILFVLLNYDSAEAQGYFLKGTLFSSFLCQVKSAVLESCVDI